MDKITVYYVPPPPEGGGRSYKLILQGLIEHPQVTLVGDKDCSDYIFHHYQGFPMEHTPEESKRVVFIDFNDHPNQVFAPYCTSEGCLAYFKRSWPNPTPDGRRANPTNPAPYMHPISYGVMSQFAINEPLERDIPLACYLREHDMHPSRARVLDLVRSLDVPGKIVGPITDGDRKTHDLKYLMHLARTKITVSANPELWEGDSRTWAALANGTLLIVDTLYTPMRHPLVDGKHCIFFDRCNMDELKDKIMYYLNHPEEAEVIAKAGQEFVMQHHRAVDRVDEMLSIIK